MPSGALMQLVAVGAGDIRQINRNIAHDYKIYQSNTSNYISLSRDSDIIVPEYLELTFSNSERNNLDDVKKLVLNMSIGGTIIEQFPLSLLINLNEPIVCDEKMYINLCFDMLFGNIKLIGLQYHDVMFQFTNNDVISCISRWGLVCKLTFLDTEERRQTAQNSHEEFIQQISFINVMADINDASQTSNVYELKNLPFVHFTKGIFIECNDVDNLNNIFLQFNEVERFNLNRFLVRTKCKKINQNVLYFPFNYDKEYSDRSNNSYEGAPNFSRLDNITLRLNFDNPINNVKIYNLHKNMYMQRTGMGGLSFSPDFCSSNIDLRNYPFTRQVRVVSGQGLTTGTTIVYTGPTNKPIILIDVSNCPIICEEIGQGGKYMTCTQCNNNFNETAIKQWLESRRPTQRTCPLCRVQWSNYEIYINGEET